MAYDHYIRSLTAVNITLPFHTCLEDGEYLFIMRCIILFCRQVLFAEICHGVEPIIIFLQEYGTYSKIRGIGLHNRRFVEVW